MKKIVIYIPGLFFLLLEMGVSGYYTPVNVLWLAIRVGIISVYVSTAYVGANYKEYSDTANKVISWMSVMLIPLTLMSARNEWKNISSQKLVNGQVLEKTKIVPPSIPKLPDCQDLTKWRKDECDKKLEKLQLSYSVALEKYNSKIEKSENRIKSVDDSLSFSDQLPIFLYLCFSVILSLLAMLAVPDNHKNTNQEIPTKIRLDKELKEISVKKIINEKKKFPKKSYENICKENGIVYKSFDRWKKEMSSNVRNNVRNGLEGEQENNEGVIV